MKYSTILSENPLNNVANVMDAGLKAQGGQGIIVQNYCQAITTQSFVNFGDFEKLKDIQNKINKGLEKAKENANYYIGTLQPEIITNISNIDNYFNLYNAVPVILPAGSTNEQWINVLKTLETQANQYSALSKSTADKIGIYYVRLGEDAAEFQANVTTLNSIVGGNNGVLKELEKEISSIDGKIAGVIGGIVGSGLAVVGGIFLIAVGTVAGFVTAGTSAPIAVAGGVLLVGGIAGAAGFSVALANLLEAKSNAWRSKENLEGEVKAISGISASYNDLFTQVNSAQKAANEMKNAWEFLSSDLGTLAYDLGQGIISADEVRTLWLTAANNAVETVKGDIRIIKGQMTGLQTATAPNNESLEVFVRNQARSQSSLSFPDAFSRWSLN